MTSVVALGDSFTCGEGVGVRVDPEAARSAIAKIESAAGAVGPGDSRSAAAVDEPAPAESDAAAAVRARRARAGIPVDVGHVPKWQLALDMIDELDQWGQHPPLVVADAGYGNNGDFRHGLAIRGLSYVVQVEDDLSAYPADAVPEVKPYPGVGPYPKPRYRTQPTSLREHVLAAGRGDEHDDEHPARRGEQRHGDQQPQGHADADRRRQVATGPAGRALARRSVHRGRGLEGRHH